MAMPAARAIRYKSGLAPANTLRAFRFYPYCIIRPSISTHCQAALPSHFQSPPISAAAPVQWWMRKKGMLKPALKKLFMKIGERPGCQSNLT